MKTCKRCKTEHESRWAMCDQCREKQRSYSAKWREDNYEPRPRRQPQPDEVRRAKRREWYQRNREREAARSKDWARKNPERARAFARETIRRAWATEAGRQRIRDNGRRKSLHRRAILRQVSIVGFSQTALEARLSMYSRCWICKTAEPTQVDHVKPLAKGGAHILANLRPACANCNTSKGSKWPFPIR